MISVHNEIDVRETDFGERPPEHPLKIIIASCMKSDYVRGCVRLIIGGVTYHVSASDFMHAITNATNCGNGAWK